MGAITAEREMERYRVERERQREEKQSKKEGRQNDKLSGHHSRRTWFVTLNKTHSGSSV